MKPTSDIIRFDQRLKREREASERKQDIKTFLLNSLTLIALMTGIYWAVMFLAVAMWGFDL